MEREGLGRLEIFRGRENALGHGNDGTAEGKPAGVRGGEGRERVEGRSEEGGSHLARSLARPPYDAPLGPLGQRIRHWPVAVMKRG